MKYIVTLLHGEEKNLKLLVNTFYGIIASSHYDTGNLLIANIITARARVQVWLLAKALNGFQTITDGTTYQPGKVTWLKETEAYKKKPGFHKLSNISETSKRNYNLTYKSLGNKDWSAIFKRIKNDLRIEERKELEELDNLVTNHLKEFWSNYKIEIYFKIEHKLGH